MKERGQRDRENMKTRVRDIGKSDREIEETCKTREIGKNVSERRRFCVTESLFNSPKVKGKTEKHFQRNFVSFKR